MKFKRTKWAIHKYSDEALKGQHVWRGAQKRRGEILDSLHTTYWLVKREEYHKLLDKRLDGIERSEEKARGFFPEVEESFTVSEMTL